MPNIIPLQFATLCESCTSIVNSREIRGEVCPACGAQGTMLSVARILNPNPALGAITYVFNGGEL